MSYHNCVFCDLTGCKRFEKHDAEEDETPAAGWIEVTMLCNNLPHSHDFCSPAHAAEWLRSTELVPLEKDAG